MRLTSRQSTMRGAVVRRQVGATKHGNENRRYDLLLDIPVILTPIPGY